MRFFDNFYRVVGTIAAKMVVKELADINKKLRKIMANLEERFNALNAKLEEASKEILAELEKLRNMELPAEAEASLQAIETKANAMADISPPVEPPPA